VNGSGQVYNLPVRTSLEQSMCRGGFKTRP